MPEAEKEKIVEEAQAVARVAGRWEAAAERARAELAGLPTMASTTVRAEGVLCTVSRWRKRGLQWGWAGVKVA